MYASDPSPRAGKVPKADGGDLPQPRIGALE